MRLDLVINPRSDREFHALVRKLVDRHTSPEALERALREVYPVARVRVRVISDEQGETWYVYREGRWVPND